MAVRDDFAAGEVLAAADLNDTFAAKLDVLGSKILQVARGTDGGNRSTTSTSNVDVGLSVAITPAFTGSKVILWAVGFAQVSFTTAGDRLGSFTIADSSNNAVSGAARLDVGNVGLPVTTGTILQHVPISIAGFSTPATTSPVTYKLRFRVQDAGTTLAMRNDVTTGQLFAFEVSE